MTGFLSFFIILAASVVFSTLFKRLHLPWVTALIAAGVLIGPFGLGWFEPTGTFELLGQIGLVFLMFMAGLEGGFGTFKKEKKRVATIAFVNSIIPFLAGVAVVYFFGYSMTSALLVGIIFISSSIAVSIPLLQANGLLSFGIGKTIVSVTVLQDLSSLILLSVVLQSTNGLANLPLPLFYFLLFAALVILRWLITKVRWLLITDELEHDDMFEREVRIIFAILIGTVIIFELLGLHPIIAGFFAGFVLSDSIKSPIFREKIHTISYGLFIPIFFIVVGAKTDLSVFMESAGTVGLIVALVLTSLVATFISGWLAGRAVGLGNRESALIGCCSIPQLSTTLAVAFTALEFGLIDQPLSVSIIVLSIVSTAVGSVVINIAASSLGKQKQFEYAE